MRKQQVIRKIVKETLLFQWNRMREVNLEVKEEKVTTVVMIRLLPLNILMKRISFEICTDMIWNCWMTNNAEGQLLALSQVPLKDLNDSYKSRREKICPNSKKEIVLNNSYFFEQVNKRVNQSRNNDSKLKVLTNASYDSVFKDLIQVKSVLWWNFFYFCDILIYKLT